MPWEFYSRRKHGLCGTTILPLFLNYSTSYCVGTGEELPVNLIGVKAFSL
jgi:hypothetical protein